MRRGGRQKGTPNKKTQLVIDRLSELQCNPIEGMIRIAQYAESAGELTIALSAYKELAQYCYPKRKAVDAPEAEGPHREIEIRIVGVDPDQKKEIQ